MRLLMSDVAAFYKACNIPVFNIPTIPADVRKALLIKLIDEAVIDELLPAMYAGDIVEIADAIADSIYVLIGTALEYGIPLDAIWAIVQRSNMQKADPTTGKCITRADGKILKPAGWKPPTEAIKACLDDYIEHPKERF